MTWVKICATTNLRDGQASVAAGANALGFIFAPSTRRIEVRSAADIVAALPAEVEKIGVFVNETPERVAEIAEQVGLTGVQLHGDELGRAIRRISEDVRWTQDHQNASKHASCWQIPVVRPCKNTWPSQKVLTPSCSIQVCRANAEELGCRLTGKPRCRW